MRSDYVGVCDEESDTVLEGCKFLLLGGVVEELCLQDSGCMKIFTSTLNQDIFIQGHA